MAEVHPEVQVTAEVHPAVQVTAEDLQAVTDDNVCTPQKQRRQVTHPNRGDSPTVNNA